MRVLFALLFAARFLPFHVQAAEAPDFTKQVYPILSTYCAGCHVGTEAESGYRLDSFAALIQGGDSGMAVVAGQPENSLLLQRITDADNPMPPEGEPTPSKAQIDLIRQWILSGAPEGFIPQTMSLPEIPLQAEIEEPIHSLAWRQAGKSLLLGRLGRIELLELNVQNTAASKRLPLVEDLSGPVNDLEVITNSKGEQICIAVSGVAGVNGEIVRLNLQTGDVEQRWKGHNDTIYCVAVSPDQKWIATGSYDQTIILWNYKTGARHSQLTGHNGAVFDLAFRPDGRLLASASSDRTIKLWNVSTGERLETLSEPTQDQTTLAFSDDGKQLVAGGADNRLRIWEIGSKGKEGTNRLLYTRFAHDAPILEVAFTADGDYLITTAQDRLIKTWRTKDYTQQKVYSTETDWVSGMELTSENDLAVARMDGSWTIYGGLQAATSLQLSDVLPDRIELPVSAPAHQLPSPVEVIEQVNNDTMETAQAMELPVKVKATFNTDDTRIDHPLGDLDWYRFEAKKGTPWIIETSTRGAKQSSDTRVEIRDTQGKRIVRMLLKSVRDSYVTFRKVDAKENDIRFMNWEEMDLRNYVYLGGEVLRIYRMPQGPDSGFRFFASKGSRRTYFNTTGITHDLEDPVYVVEPYASDAVLVDNGLPVFPVYYENDDDGWHELGTDSRLDFMAPADGTYFVRVSEVKQASGSEHEYSLILRHPAPDFSLSVNPASLKLNKGSGQNLGLTLDRADEFEGPVEVRFENIPEGLIISQPVIIEQGHLDADVAVFCQTDADISTDQWAALKIIATATIDGKQVVKQNQPFAKSELTGQASIEVNLRPDHPAKPCTTPGWENYPVVELRPGTSTTATIFMQRNSFDGEMKFEVQNLPHGVIVDNIGLSGVLVRTGEHKRQIFLTSADWVTPQERLFHAMSQGAGKQVSMPVVLRVLPVSSLASSKH